MEVWLLESTYYEDMFEEIYLHEPNTDLWFTNIGHKEECIESSRFTESFWENKDNTNLLTYLGKF